MKLIKLENQEYFDQLKKGDTIIVHWNLGSYEYKKGNEIGTYSMIEINNSNEIILRKKDNIYFNIGMYLKGESNAKEAYVLFLAFAEGHERRKTE